MSIIPESIYKVAYKKLKQMVYYEKNHLFLRKRLAEFESSDDFELRLSQFEQIISNENPTEHPDFKNWLAEINYILLPKSIKANKRPNKESGTFITNVTSQHHYEIEKVNYIFDGPIELHLIAVLWLIIEGSKIDSDLPKNCMGTRLHHLVGQDEDYSGNLFKKYHELYAQWRDSGIKKARDLLLNDKENVCIIALDFQEFFYRVQVDWAELRSNIKRPVQKSALHDYVFGWEILGERLFDCLEAICNTYRLHIDDQLSITHPNLPKTASCLPIGLCSSPVIANWYLKEFDNAILKEVHPAYYGRYVDDILLVVTKDAVPPDDPIKGVMNEVLVKTRIMNFREDYERYEVSMKPGLFLQRQKCIVQFFDATHSIAGLEKFKKEIEENASDFAMLPVEGDDSPVEQVAYDLLYDGSISKLRNVKEIAENRLELATYLSKQTQLMLITSGESDENLKKELFNFFKGRNAIEYWDLWERVISYFVVSSEHEAVIEFIELVDCEIKRIRFSSQFQECDLDENVPRDRLNTISNNLRNSLKSHLETSTEISKALDDSNAIFPDFRHSIWRQSNLIRHHLVTVPLLNYTDYTGNLIKPKDVVQVVLEPSKINLSPRFVHFDECISLADSGFLENSNGNSINEADLIYVQFHGSMNEDVVSESINKDQLG